MVGNDTPLFIEVAVGPFSWWCGRMERLARDWKISVQTLEFTMCREALIPPKFKGGLFHYVGETRFLLYSNGHNRSVDFLVSHYFSP